jgi:hypothetical protein
MSVSSIGIGVRYGAQAQAAAAARGLAPISSVPAGAGEGDGESKISDFGAAMADLRQLQLAAPERFKAAAQQVSASLSERAAAASGPYGQFLSHLSSRFQQAADAGDLSPLQPSDALSVRIDQRHSQVRSYATQQATDAHPPNRPPSELAGVIRTALASVGG